jgi:TatD DNase family protein
VLSDTHCHLYFDLFDEDREEVIVRAWENGVKKILLPGIDLSSSHQAVEFANQHANLFAAVGVHPNDGATWNVHTLNELSDLCRHPKVVAIGEIGLDYYRQHSTPELQKEILHAQLDLAVQSGKPVILHNRQSTDDLIQILSEWVSGLKTSHHPLADRPGVVHSFQGDLAEANRLIEMNFFLGISGPITYKNSKPLQIVIRELPLDYLLLETDAPFLSPHPYRGKRNEPANIPIIAEMLANIKEKPFAEIAEQTENNAKTLFAW